MRSATCRCKPLSPQSTKPKVKWLALHACMPLMIWINLCVRVCILSRSSNETEKRRTKLMTALLFASLRVPGRWLSKNGLYPCERAVEPAAFHAQYAKHALTGSIKKQTPKAGGRRYSKVGKIWHLYAKMLLTRMRKRVTCSIFGSCCSSSPIKHLRMHRSLYTRLWNSHSDLSIRIHTVIKASVKQFSTLLQVGF